MESSGWVSAHSRHWAALTTAGETEGALKASGGLSRSCRPTLEVTGDLTSPHLRRGAGDRAVRVCLCLF